MTDTFDYLDEIRERLKAATPGPWTHEGWAYRTADHEESYGVWKGERPVDTDPYHLPHPPLARTVRERQGWDDAAFIAAARTDIPRLVGAVLAALACAEAMSQSADLLSDVGRHGVAVALHRQSELLTESIERAILP